jgi:glycosyltransferase involved in cell wall biosynthesis
LTNQLAKDYKLKIIVYTWAVHDKVDWGIWDERINIRIVPYSRYFQKLIAKIFYYLWVKIDRPDNIILNFLYHGETALPAPSNIYYVLHSPASLIPHRYEYIREKANQFNHLSFIAVSDFVKQSAMPYLENKNIEVIFHGIDLNRFSHPVEYVNKGKIKLLTVAALEEWKGIQHVISILSDNELKNEFEYTIIGEGSYKNDLIEMINQNNLSSHVRFIDFEEKVESILPNYDIYCHLSDGEAFGLSLIESMACGLPIIVYDIPPFDTLFPTNIAIKLKNKSKELLKESLLELMSVNERKRIGESGRDFVRDKFMVENMAARYIQKMSQVEL